MVQGWVGICTGIVGMVGIQGDVGGQDEGGLGVVGIKAV